jgi:histidyl-tRNA synthetase
MALATKPYKGARDFYPEDKRLQKYLFATMRRVAESFGYEEYDAPVLEPLELYKAKTGDEIVNEQTYAFTDRGDREVALRPEMTPTVSRLVAGRRQELGYPLRLFNIGPRWRYERQQRGRYREFFQCDVDLFGVSGQAAELEIIQVADAMMKAFGAQRDMYVIKLSSRRFIDHLLGEYFGFDEVQKTSVMRLVDRKHKLPEDEFLTQLDGLCTPSQRESQTVERLMSFLQIKQPDGLPDGLGGHEALQPLRKLLQSLRDNGISNAEFDPTLMRGFDYYTDIVFEVFDTDPENNRAMFGGGRYDGLVGLFGVDPLPTVGFAMGDATLINFLETHDLTPKLAPETHVYVALVGDADSGARRVAGELRQDGVNVALDISGQKLDKQIKTADKKGIRYVLIVGPKELESDQFTLKDLQTGNEESHSLARIASILEDRRRGASD